MNLSRLSLAPFVVLALSCGCASAPPKEAAKVYEQAMLQAEEGKTQEAMQTLRKGVERFPAATRLRFELARFQYEAGEAHHLRERAELRKAARFMEQGQRREALTHRRLGNEHRAKALPFYTAARDNLHVVVEQEEDERRAAWAYYLLMRVEVFFENWSAADEAIEQAILLGNPSGALLAQWREFQAGIKEQLRTYED
ncbi:MAG: hypothetical protein D6731_26185 [Planctomycetota bacterium]|nr:MAG: hypothetical protein D6731_26185 [Planctomycetota bacterium]